MTERPIESANADDREGMPGRREFRKSMERWAFASLTFEHPLRVLLKSTEFALADQVLELLRAIVPDVTMQLAPGNDQHFVRGVAYVKFWKGSDPFLPDNDAAQWYLIGKLGELGWKPMQVGDNVIYFRKPY